jgi:hypothetical protein
VQGVWGVLRTLCWVLRPFSVCISYVPPAENCSELAILINTDDANVSVPVGNLYIVVDRFVKNAFRNHGSRDEG